MFKSIVLKLAAAGLALTAAGSGAAQVTTIDPNQADNYQVPSNAAQPDPLPEWTPVEQGEYVPTDEPVGEAQVAPDVVAPTALTDSTTVPRRDIFSAAETVFGRGAEGLAGVIERILRDQGEPNAYIAGQEAGGAFVVGVRYGSGTMHHQVEGQRAVYWTGPSLGFDFGADASKVFVLVYNLHDSQDLFRRFPGAEGNAYVVGGFTASYHRRGDVVLIPVRLGVGLRLGVNAGYMRFSEKNRWLPF